MPEPIFIDTWGWITRGHHRDLRHLEVKRFYQELSKVGGVFYTSDYILDEMVTLLFRRELFGEAVRFVEGIFESAQQRQLTIERITSDRFAAAWRLRKHFQDKHRISFTDLTSMVLMQELGLTKILTEDEHFLQVGMGFQKMP